MSQKYCSECQKNLRFPLVCVECQHLQAFHDANFFEIFGMPQNYQSNFEQLEENYEELTALLHPDLYANCSSQIQGLSRQYSMLLNQAYKVLNNHLERAIYLFNLEFKKPLSDSVLPQNFLTEMFGLQERVANSKQEQEEINNQIQQKIQQQEEERVALFESEHTAESFDRLQQNINATRYLVRFLEHQESGEKP